MKKYLALLLAAAMSLSMTGIAFAATGSKTVGTTGKMTLYLGPSASGTSSEVIFDFNLSGIPANATVTKVTVNCPKTGATSIVSTSLNVKSESMSKYVSTSFPSGSINPGITSGLTDQKVKANWYASFSGTNADYMYAAAKEYAFPTMTIEYNY